MLHDPDRTSATCFFMGHQSCDRTFLLWSGSAPGAGASPSETATVQTAFLVSADDKHRAPEQ